MCNITTKADSLTDADTEWPGKTVIKDALHSNMIKEITI